MFNVSPRQQAVEDVPEAENAAPRQYLPLKEKQEYSRSALQSVQDWRRGPTTFDVGATRSVRGLLSAEVLIRGSAQGTSHRTNPHGR